MLENDLVPYYGVFTPYTGEGNYMMISFDEPLTVEGWSIPPRPA